MKRAALMLPPSSQALQRECETLGASLWASWAPQQAQGDHDHPGTGEDPDAARRTQAAAGRVRSLTRRCGRLHVNPTRMS